MRRFIYLFNLLIGRRLDSIGSVSTQQLYDKTIEIFRARTDNDLFHINLNASVAGKIVADSFSKFKASTVWLFIKQKFTPIGKYPPHSFT